MNEQSRQTGDDMPDARRDLAGLLGGLFGGQLPQQGGGSDFQPTLPSGKPVPQGGDNDVANILGGLLGGGQGQSGGMSQTGGYGGQSQGGYSSPSQSGYGGSPQGGSDLGNLLGGLLSGSGGMGQQGSYGSGMGQGSYGGQQQDPFGMGGAGGGDLMGMLGGLLGGGMGSSGGMGQSGYGQQDPYGGMGSSGGMGGLGGLLGGLLGGGGGMQSSGGMGGLLGGLIGSPQASHMIAQQTGLSPALVQALLPMIIGLLARGGQRSGMRSQGIDIDGDGRPDTGDELTNVVQRVQHGDPIDEQELRSSGFTRALARHSGYSEQEVAPATLRILQVLAQNQQ